MMKPVESKVSFATIGSLVGGGGLAPLVIWLFPDIPTDAADVVSYLVIAGFGVIGTFVGGYFKQSSTSSVSDGFVPPQPPPEPRVPYNPDA